ncbi:N-acetyltransferase GCN5 [Allostella sp. ATCC 35155]|nr:N-acetyltransferase GCN5 [Stella sp. ATCC 35155]
MRIIVAGPSDAGWLALLHGRCFPAEPWHATEWEVLLRQPGVRVAATVDGGQPAGFILTRHAADEAEILSLGVLPECRRSGAGRRLLEDALTALPVPVATVFLEVAVDNPAALALYAGAGFRPVGRRPAYYRTNRGAVDALMLRLVRANALCDKWKSEAGPGNHGRETSDRV